ncbi:MAG: A/G-specific adenine glycosylase [Flavobacteriaceae bacterium]|nr:A/G-specific adenine glycosylase [Flavobacteriaceae bacterium]
MKKDLVNKISKKFAINLINWYSDNKRCLPWRETKNPFKIWLSEIILQQTQIKQGLPYYQRFIKLFPNVESLAFSEEEYVLKKWEGLGYYNRARNMHKAAKIVVHDYNGKFPTSYNELIKLPGIGDYSASAISSFSSNEIRPVLDGNVYRLISRIFHINNVITSSKSVKVFKGILNILISKKNPADFNQAIMDYGSLICKPKNPNCLICIFKSDCLAFKHNSILKFPVKKNNFLKKMRIFNYLVIIDSSKKIVLNKRIQKDIWQNLFDFPMIETKKKINKSDVRNYLASEHFIFHKIKSLKFEMTQNHKLSHQNLTINYWLIRIDGCLNDSVEIKKISNYPLPKPLHSFVSTLDRFLK